MADSNETAKTSLVFDASGAKQGAADFRTASEQVIAAAEKSASAVDASEVKKAASRTRGSKAAKDASTAEAQAAAAGADAVVEANNRIVRSSSQQIATLDRYAKAWDPLAASAGRAAQQLNTIWDIAQKTRGDVQARALGMMTEAVDRLNKATRDLAAGFDVDKRIEQLTAKFDPAQASVRAMVAELAELNQAQRLGINIAGGYVAAQDKIIASYSEGAQAAAKAAAQQREMIAAARASQQAQSAPDARTLLGLGGAPGAGSAAASAAVFEEAAAAEDALAKETTRLTALFKPATVAAEQYKAALQDVDAALSLGVINSAEASAQQTRLADAYAKGSFTAAGGLKNLTNSVFGARFAQQQLGVQTIQFFSSLQAGQPFLMAFIGQAHQVADVAIATGTGFRVLAQAVGNFFTAIGRWILANPLVTALIAGTAALATMGVVAEATTRRLLNLQNQLRGVREDFVASQQMIENAARHLASTTSLGTSEARAAGTQIALNPAFQGTQEQMEDLIKLAHSLAVTMGIELPDATALVVKGFDNAAASAQELLDKGIGQTKGLTQAWVDSLKQMSRPEAFQAFADMLRKITAGSVDRITELQKAWERFQQLMTSDSEGFWHSIGQRVADGLAVVLNMINSIIEAWQKFKLLTGGDEAERVRAQMAAQGGVLNPTGVPGQDPRGWTANNPLNLMIPGTMTPQPFTSLESGIAANLQQLLKYQERGLTTVEQIVKKWVSDPKADLTSYIADIQKATGTAPGAAINLRDPAIAAAFFRAAQPHETGPKRLTEAQINAGVQLGLSGVTAGAGGGGGTGVVSTQAGDINAAQAASANALSARIAENAAAQRVQQAGIDASLKQAQDALAKGDRPGFEAASRQAIRYSEALDQLKGSATDLITEQQKITRGLQDSLHPLSQAAGAGRTLAEVEEQFREAARAANGGIVDQTALSAALAAKQAQLSAAANDNVKATDLQTNAQRALISAYEEGGAALQHSLNFEQAVIKARETAVVGTVEYQKQVIALTEALDRQAQVERDVAAAKDINKIEQATAATQKEFDLINATIDVRTREMAILKERQALMLANGQVADMEQQKAIDAAAKFAALQQNLSVQKQALNDITGAFSSAFDTIGDSITQALISGQGKAINFRNVMTSVAQQILQAFLKMAVLNPILNSLFPGSGHRSTLGDVFGALENVTPGSSSSSSSGGGGTGILGTIFSLVSSIGGLFGGGAATGPGNFPDLGAIQASSIAAAGALPAASPMSLPGLYHSGGIVGANDNNPMRSIPAAMLANAPRFHSGYSGVRADELPAILQRGERVLTQRDDDRIRSTIGGMTEQLASGMAEGNNHRADTASRGDNVTISIDARNSTPQAVDSFRRSLPQIASTMSDQMQRAKSRNG